MHSGGGFPADDMAIVPARGSAAGFMSLVLDARKPISTFAKLLTDRHGGESVRGLKKEGGARALRAPYHVQLIAATLQMQMSDFDEFAKKVVLPRTTPRLPKTFFADRIVNGSGRHMRAFAAEVLTAVNVLAMFVQLILKPAGILTEHVKCFEAMQRFFALFKRGTRDDPSFIIAYTSSIVGSGLGNC